MEPHPPYLCERLNTPLLLSVQLLWSSGSYPRSRTSSEWVTPLSLSVEGFVPNPPLSISWVGGGEPRASPLRGVIPLF